MPLKEARLAGSRSTFSARSGSPAASKISTGTYDQRVDAGLVLHRLPFLSDSPFVTREGMSPSEEYASMSRTVALCSRASIEAEERRAGL